MDHPESVPERKGFVLLLLSCLLEFSMMAGGGAAILGPEDRYRAPLLCRATREKKPGSLIIMELLY